MTNTPANRARVTTSRHITVENPPKDWYKRAEFVNWRVGAANYLCGFVEMERADGSRYLTSTVF